MRRGWQPRLARRDARRGTRRTGPSRTWCEAKREAAPLRVCLTDIDWVPAWAPRASCGDHERRAPARRRRRRRGPDRKCAAADLARRVSAAAPRRAASSIRLCCVELPDRGANLPDRRPPRRPPARRAMHEPTAVPSTCPVLSSPAAAPKCPPADLSLCI